MPSDPVPAPAQQRRSRAATPGAPRTGSVGSQAVSGFSPSSHNSSPSETRAPATGSRSNIPNNTSSSNTQPHDNSCTSIRALDATSADCTVRPITADSANDTSNMNSDNSSSNNNNNMTSNSSSSSSARRRRSSTPGPLQGGETDLRQEQSTTTATATETTTTSATSTATEIATSTATATVITTATAEAAETAEATAEATAELTLQRQSLAATCGLCLRRLYRIGILAFWILTVLMAKSLSAVLSFCWGACSVCLRVLSAVARNAGFILLLPCLAVALWNELTLRDAESAYRTAGVNFVQLGSQGSSTAEATAKLLPPNGTFVYAVLSNLSASQALADPDFGFEAPRGVLRLERLTEHCVLQTFADPRSWHQLTWQELGRWAGIQVALQLAVDRLSPYLVWLVWQVRNFILDHVTENDSIAVIGAGIAVGLLLVPVWTPCYKSIGGFMDYLLPKLPRSSTMWLSMPTDRFAVTALGASAGGLHLGSAFVSELVGHSAPSARLAFGTGSCALLSGGLAQQAPRCLELPSAETASPNPAAEGFVYNATAGWLLKGSHAPDPPQGQCQEGATRVRFEVRLPPDVDQGRVSVVSVVGQLSSSDPPAILPLARGTAGLSHRLGSFVFARPGFWSAREALEHLQSKAWAVACRTRAILLSVMALAAFQGRHFWAKGLLPGSEGGGPGSAVLACSMPLLAFASCGALLRCALHFLDSGADALLLALALNAMVLIRSWDRRLGAGWNRVTSRASCRFPQIKRVSSSFFHLGPGRRFIAGRAAVACTAVAALSAAAAAMTTGPAPIDAQAGRIHHFSLLAAAVALGVALWSAVFIDRRIEHDQGSEHPAFPCEGEVECPTCWDEPPAGCGLVLIPCGHATCYSCLGDLLAQGRWRCPVCRRLAWDSVLLQ
ncbi:unnamed protein product [Polarella glacialis]|uniref:RING-type domain-containing protein n=1 Tax=Polarella glacialis TaxID=89957 RepID=A0A813GF66_POLGL|nr:unnamed protein product [Polarella glacialis]CAE8622789.1 unnamed protein product [Polarella glacialis]